MSSAPPTRQALTQLINNGPDLAPSQRQRRDRRPSERALYQAEEEQDRNVRRQNVPRKIKATRKKSMDEVHDGAQFSSQTISLSNASVPAHGLLDLRPRFNRVPPPDKHKRDQSSSTLVQSSRPSSTHTPDQSSQSGGWREDALTKDSGFINRGHVSNDNSVPSAPRKLTVARAKELMQLRQAQSAVTTRGDSDDDLDQSDGEQNPSNNYEDYNNEDYMDCDDVFMDRDGEDNAHCNGLHKRPRSPSDNEGDSTLQRDAQVRGLTLPTATASPTENPEDSFCARLASEYAYPDRMTQVLWAKEAWKEGCAAYEIEMGFNSEIIQIITRRTSHLTSQVKGKVRSLVENIYGFEHGSRESVKSRNRRLARQLKSKFGLCYRNLGDEKHKVPRSGLFRTKLNQKAANLLWYSNKKDEGVMFDKLFTLFPIPALALVYTAAECCVDEWVDGERIDISFSCGEYKEAYDKHLANLKKFHVRTKDHGILDGILKEINDNGRIHAKVDPADVGDADCLSDDEIHNAIREYQQGSGVNETDDEDEDYGSHSEQNWMRRRVE
ncbi:hypothetical protein DEU56DRAFT_949198 [Suillus clintonianus]|uniref:uncharacterized protein n=1 Tax=Suillus clintonianus TaxID=1904413 RepID=UPI001B878FDF|nr:uncharacterized protein DEU56DRAFT_949198 [Suillus clintonianus]KAG2135269.1 hypothetical protein DEU56DRAFT_949198 [Suillus clintonianus]